MIISPFLGFLSAFLAEIGFVDSIRFLRHPSSPSVRSSFLTAFILSLFLLSAIQSANFKKISRFSAQGCFV